MNMHRTFSRGAVMLGCLLTVLRGSGQERVDTLTASDVFNLELVRDPQISPDGRRIVYVRRFIDIMADRLLSNLWVINFDGTGHRPLTTGYFTDTSPRWSPDGSRMIFVSDRSGSQQIHTLAIDSGQLAQLTNVQHAPRYVAWSPDGTQIAFAAFVPEPARRYGPAPAPPAGARWGPSVRVIDQFVYVIRAGYLQPGYSHWFTVPAEGGTPRQVSTGSYNYGAGPAVWTPDGQYLLLSAYRGSDPESESRGTEIYELAVTDGSARALTNRNGPDTSPIVSPDGKQIAYLGFDDEGFNHQLNRLYVMSRDGSGSRMLLHTLDRDVEQPRWAPDGSGIYVFYVDQGTTKLGFTTLDGRLKEVAGNLGGGYDYGVALLGLGQASFSVASGGRFAFTYTATRVPCDVAVGTAGGGGVRVITAVNQDLLATKKISDVEEIRYASSLDGRQIHGWIIKPPDFDPGKKYPLILDLHGGPWAAYGNGFDFEKQWMAAQGYVVFYPNYRGSVGYGFEFAHLIEKVHPGIVGDEGNPGDVTHDLNTGVDTLISRGYIDPSNLFITGGSAGGSLTFWMIAHTNRFKAAVAVSPAGANWYSFVLYSNRPDLVKYRFPGVPWEHTDHYMKRSPMSIIKNVRTPTMIINGDADYSTPIANAEEYYFALKWLKVDTVLIRVPEDGHGIFNYPSHYVSRIEHTLSWFDRYRTTTRSSSPGR